MPRLTPIDGQDEIDACRLHVGELLLVPARVEEAHRADVGGVVDIRIEASLDDSLPVSVGQEPVEEVGPDQPLVGLEAIDREVPKV